ncbi:cytochrome P450 [Streptomyces sp. NPDC048290]|uniref:cytochrome P450 family protein n=1 Tax=Streptomyces sp. NPDC048290 TaxID=3155811 RepID=UPI003426DFDB
MSVEPPPETVRLLNRSFMRDPYPALRELRERCPAVPVENGGFRMWVVTRYEDARRILADPSLSRDLVAHRRAVVAQNLVDDTRRPRLPRELRRSMLDQDGEDHLRLRRTVSRFFSPSRLDELRPRIEERADALLDGLPTGVPLDLVDAYARPLPATVLAELLGVPEEARAEFPAWENAILTAPGTAEVEDAGRRLAAFAREVIEEKRARPADDLFTEVVRAAADGVMDDTELISMITLLTIAGLEPASAIGSGVLTLLDHPDELALVRARPALMADCVEEVLRYETPFRMLTPRFLDHPLELDGVTVPAGELILVSTGAANRDPGRFDSPDAFRADRCPRGHLGFSHGSHRCLGAELGRLETTIALDRFFARFPDTRLAAPRAEVPWRPGMFMRRLDALPVVLE